MSADREGALAPVALGFRALKGGAVVVGVAADGDEPRVVRSSFVATAAEGDRLSLEPYLVAAEMKRPPGGGISTDAAAAVADGRKRQEELATKGLGDIIASLRDTRHEPVVAALLVNRAGWVTDLLGYGLSGPEHARVAEGLAVREAFRIAFRRRELQVAEVDEKSLHETASRNLNLSAAEIDARLKHLGATVGRPWRKEQKLACLAAWTTITALRART